MWSLPRAGITPVSCALAGELLTTGPPEKSRDILYPQGASSNNPSLQAALPEVLPFQHVARCLMQSYKEAHFDYATRSLQC